MRKSFMLIVVILGVLSTFSVVAQDDEITFEERDLTVDGQERNYLLYIPPTYDASNPVPLVFVFHGGGGNPELYEEVTAFGEKARDEGFILVYPAGSSRRQRLLTWNAGHCCGYAQENDIDDVAFFRAIVADLTAEFNVDFDRIYAAGHSNGGMLTYRLAAEASDILAAVGVMAGTIGGYPTVDSNDLIVIAQPENPVSVIHIHGMADENVPYAGGESNGALDDPRIDLSVAESINFWLDADECETTPTTETSDDAMVITDIYDCPETGTTVALISIVDGGHAWAGGNPGSRLSDTPSERVSATDEVWAFFLAHPRP